MTYMRPRSLQALGCALLLGGCMVAKQPAPIVERSPEPVRPATAKPKPAVAAPAPPSRPAAEDARPTTYTVKRGDTLFGIALDHGQDYRDIARWNNLADPNVIEVGQVLVVRDPAVARQAAGAPQATAGGAVTTPYASAPAAEAKEVGVPAAKPLPDTRRPAAAEGTTESGVVSGPKAIKLPYSEAALAKLRAPASGEAAAKPAPAPPVAEVAAAKPDVVPPKSDPSPAGAGAEDPEGITWAWPAKGTILASFSENGGPKGVQIAGELGQAVLASAGGRVVYTGSGIRGYGNLVIIKHNNTYLSAYAHNRVVLVKQGDNVARGQKIAEMGNSDASRVMLHFEIRRLGKPVDPVKFLPPA